MNTIKIIVVLIFLSSCKGNVTSIKSLETDSIIVRLKQLNDTALTRIEISPSIFFADTINEGQTIEGRFKIVNKGKVPLALKKIINVCDCTVTESSKSETRPNDSCFLSFKIETDNFKPGFNVRVITIIGNFHPLFRTLSVECYVRLKK